MNGYRPGALFWGICLLLLSSSASAQAVRIGLLPIQNTAHLKPKTVRYLEDLVNSTFREQLADHPAVLVPERDIETAARAAKYKTGDCDNHCASEIGAAADASLVVLPELLRLGKAYRCALKLIDVETETMLSMKRATGADADEMESNIPTAVDALVTVMLDANGHTDAAAGDTTREGFRGYANLTVRAMGVPASEPDKAPVEIAAEVYINGTHVGQTPYEDGLPQGRYRVEMRFRNEPSRIAEVRAVAGETYYVNGKFVVRPTPEEIAAKQRALEMERDAQYTKELEAYQSELDKWQTQKNDLMPKRRKLILAGALGLPAGIGSIIAGGVMMGLSKRARENRDRFYAAWYTSTTQDDIDYYAAQIKEQEDNYTKKRASGIVLLSVGGVATAASVVALSFIPRLPKKPRKPYRQSGFGLSRLTLSPTLAPNLAGVVLHYCF